MGWNVKDERDRDLYLWLLDSVKDDELRRARRRRGSATSMGSRVADLAARASDVLIKNLENATRIYRRLTVLLRRKRALGALYRHRAKLERFKHVQTGQL